MDKIKTLTRQLATETDKGSQVEILQQLVGEMLQGYMIKIAPHFRIYPIEVEAYYYHPESFPDTSVHTHELQKSRFGQLYFHRQKPFDTDVILDEGGGMDVCLSDSDSFFLTLFIRSARINHEVDAVYGPEKLLRRVAEYVCSIKADKLTPQDIQKVKKLELRDDVLVRAEKEVRPKGSIAIYSSRIGVDTNKYYEKASLRGIIEIDNLERRPLSQHLGK